MQETVHAFWFGPRPGVERAEWFRKDDAFDAQIRERFLDVIERAVGGAYQDWCATPRGTVARVIVLDQFTRNAFRDSPRAFAGDPLALRSAEQAIAAAQDAALSLLERWFLYMPFQHAESGNVQRQSLALFSRLAHDGLPGPLSWARRHADIVFRFGRFPHRNAVLGRVSTAEEEAFLREPGSRF